MRRAGMAPDPWQEELLRSTGDTLLNCSRQIGKSTGVAALVVRTSIIRAPALTLIVSPSERQSGELLLKVKRFYDALVHAQNISGRVLTVHEKMIEEANADAAYLKVPKKARESALQLHLDNGSRIIGLPSSEATIRGYSDVALLVLEEATRVPDELYYAVRPMLMTSGGRIVAPTTPFGRRGWFYEAWIGPENWKRISVPATACSRVKAAFLESERRSLGERWYRQEYECSFEEAMGQLIPQAAIEAAVRAGDGLQAIPFGG